MSDSPSRDITQLLGQAASGDSAARGQLMEAAYDELRRLAGGMMRRERGDHTLQATALVNEAALRLLGQDALAAAHDRAYFFGMMATAMRRVLVDHARGRNAQRRGGGEYQRQGLDHVVESIEEDARIDLVSLDDALTKLSEMSERQSQVVSLRFFGGMSIPEIAEHLSVSVSTVEKDWRLARAWLKIQLDSDDATTD
jgi:RNA polymerase sigma factor (TIGR02999 family)